MIEGRGANQEVGRKPKTEERKSCVYINRVYLRHGRRNPTVRMERCTRRYVCMDGWMDLLICVHYQGRRVGEHGQRFIELGLGG